MTFLRKAFPLLIPALVAACDDPKPATGTMMVMVEGVPVGANAAVRVTGPNEYAKTVLSTETLERLAPGDYTVRASDVVHGGALYTSATTQQLVNVTAGETETTPIPYALASGSLDLTIGGLPPESHANISLRRFDGFSRSVTSSGVQHLPAGTYTLHAEATATSLGDVFGADQPTQSITLAPSLAPVAASVSYSQITGTLDLAVSGLPGGLPFDPVTVTGSDGFSRTTKTSETYHGLVPGTYTISSETAAGDCPTMYTPSSALQSVDVSAAGTANAAVAYAEGDSPPENLNLRIVNAQIIQVTQDSAGTVPMVANRPALLRVYALANQCNTATPPVRVTLSNGSVLNAPAQESSVRTRLDEGTLLSTWNVNVPGDAVQPGLTFNAVIDPVNGFVETNETDNRYPATGERAVTVVDLPPVGIRLVPIAQPLNGTAIVNADNVDQYLEFSRKVHPIATHSVTIRPPFSTDTVNISSAGDVNAWVAILNRLQAAQVVDSTNNPPGWFYHGIVNVPYQGGIAGIAFVGGRTGLTWHHLPSASPIMAHELGHSFGQSHVRCTGGEAGPDPNYPYAGGRIGRYGYDAATQTLKAPGIYTDVMSYTNNSNCASQWVSDYVYKRMLTNLESRPTLPAISGAGGTENQLLVWGRIVNGTPVIEPAFEFQGRSTPPSAGHHRLTGVARDGSVAFDVSFSGQEIADIPGNNELFAFTVPVSALGGRQLESLRLTARGRTVRNTMSVAIDATASDAQLRVTRAGVRAARVRWDATRYPVVMVRDPRTGDVLSFARGGDATIVTDGAELEVNLSNRVRSAKFRRPIQ